MGRKSLIHDKLIRDTILDHIRKGNYIKTACLAAGVPESTYHSWLNRAESSSIVVDDNGNSKDGNGNRVYVDFLEELKRARHENISMHVQNIQAAGTKFNQWQASAWLLERMNPAEYGKRLELEVGPSKVLLALREQARESLGITEGYDKPSLASPVAYSKALGQGDIIDAVVEEVDDKDSTPPSILTPEAP